MLRPPVFNQVTDTPGLVDSHLKNEEIERKIAETLAKTSPGPHVVLMVVKGSNRFTEEEYSTYTQVKKLLDDDDKTKKQKEDEKLAKHVIVVFTGQDELKASKRDIKTVIEEGSGNLKDMLKDVDYRYACINNRATNMEEKKTQMAKLMVMIQKASPKFLTYVTNELQQGMDKLVLDEAKKMADKEKNIIGNRRAKREAKLFCTKFCCRY
jgi:hypothetical protein